MGLENKQGLKFLRVPSVVGEVSLSLSKGAAAEVVCVRYERILLKYSWKTLLYFQSSLSLSLQRGAGRKVKEVIYLWRF